MVFVSDKDIARGVIETGNHGVGLTFCFKHFWCFILDRGGRDGLDVGKVLMASWAMGFL